MDTLIYRGRVRVVAYVEMFLSSLSLLVIGFMLVALMSGEMAISLNQDAIIYLWIICGFGLILTALRLWFSVGLLHATTPTCSPEIALRKARNWRYFTVADFTLGLIFFIVTAVVVSISTPGQYGGGFGFGIYRLISIVIVNRLIAELTELISSQEHSENIEVGGVYLAHQL